MASNPPGKCCTEGFKHEGTPTGEIKTVGGGKNNLLLLLCICGMLTMYMSYSKHVHFLSGKQAN